MKLPEEIKQDVVDQLSWDSRVDSSNVNVNVDNGKVTLSGNVATYSAKLAAEDAAWAVTGVTDVANNVTVEFPTTFPVPSDEEIEEYVKQSLSWNTDIDEKEITVKVENGIVTLEGSVSSFWQKTQAEEEANTTSGVLGVTNKLAVVPTEKITDEIVGERVMDRIDENTTANVDKVSVEVEDGKVTLSGIVQDWSTWHSVYNAAQYTTGVTEINDLLTIEYK